MAIVLTDNCTSYSIDESNDHQLIRGDVGLDVFDVKMVAHPLHQVSSPLALVLKNNGDLTLFHSTKNRSVVIANHVNLVSLVRVGWSVQALMLKNGDWFAIRNINIDNFGLDTSPELIEIVADFQLEDIVEIRNMFITTTSGIYKFVVTSDNDEITYRFILVNELPGFPTDSKIVSTYGTALGVNGDLLLDDTGRLFTCTSDHVTPFNNKMVERFNEKSKWVGLLHDKKLIRLVNVDGEVYQVMGKFIGPVS